MSGIIAARNKTIDVVGVAPNATLYALKVLSASGIVDRSRAMPAGRSAVELALLSP